MPAPAEMVWLPNPPRGTQITAGFDGSEYEDWTALKCVTRGGRDSAGDPRGVPVHAAVRA